LSPADILNALGNGGFALILFVCLWFVWRELTRSRIECEGQIKELRDQQMRNVSKIARLEAQTELLISLKNDLKSEKLSDQQPPPPESHKPI
jgi:ABC-type nickel/cobalt efflux system permease component RcnA